MAGSGDEGESLRDLIARLIEAAKAYVRAEIELVKHIAVARATAAAAGIAFGIVALFIVQAALTVLVAALGMALSHWLGTAGGLAVGALIALLAAGLLGWIGFKRISTAGREP